MPHLLRHEFWHVGFKHAFPEQFQREFYAEDPLRRVAYQMVNEGVGHYYSMRRRLVPRNTYDDWPERTAAIFSLLHEKLPEVKEAGDAEAQNRLIFRSHAGVPLLEEVGSCTRRDHYLSTYCSGRRSCSCSVDRRWTLCLSQPVPGIGKP